MCGWRLMVTNAPKEKLSFSQALLNYRQEWTLERCFRVLKKSHLGISPLYLRKQERLKGITRLLSIGVRLITILEYSISKNLKEAKETIKGLDVAHPNKTTATPTAISILKTFCREKINLSQITIKEKNYWTLSKISEDLIRVLKYLKIPLELYKVEYYKNWSALN
jgi:transposase